MEIDMEKAEQVKVLLNHYDARIREFERDASKVAELRAVQTLRDGAVQVLKILGLYGLIGKGEKSC